MTYLANSIATSFYRCGIIRAPMPHDNTTPLGSMNADIAWIVAVAHQLPDDTRRVLTLRYVYGMDPSDICTKLEMRRESVTQHLVAAVKAMADAHDRAVDRHAQSDERPSLPILLDMELDYTKT